MTRIRNINSIHVFDSVARFGNVTKAAHHYGSTQSSVSYHIKKLEADLRVSLFIRTAHGLELTDEGAKLASHVDAGLQRISEGIDLVTRRQSTVRVALVPMFASRLVSANMKRLQQSCPDIEIILLNHNNTFVDLADPRAFADIGIQWGKGHWAGVDAVKLWDERLVAVCSPEYRDRIGIEAPSDVQRCTLLHVDDKRMWAEWLAGCGIAFRPAEHDVGRSPFPVEFYHQRPWHFAFCRMAREGRVDRRRTGQSIWKKLPNRFQLLPRHSERLAFVTKYKEGARLVLETFC
jgi:LysR family transcriptional regulator, glycine cleavage system transcriptional activator